jgi:hypothetical protein
LSQFLSLLWPLQPASERAWASAELQRKPSETYWARIQKGVYIKEYARRNSAVGSL